MSQRAYSVGLAEYFQGSFHGRRREIVAEQKYSSDDKDFKAQLTAIKAENPDAIFVPGYYTEAGLIVLQARQLGITVPLFGGDGWEAPELIQIARGCAWKARYFSTHFSPRKTRPRCKISSRAYQAKFNGETPDAMAALGYDSAMVLADAIKRAGTTEAAKLRDALATTDFNGATGHTKIDAHRDAPKPAVIITVKDGKFKFLRDVAALTEFLQQLINGLSLGSIYALIALGYTMVYGVLRFINFAHSDVFMLGAFVGLLCLEIPGFFRHQTHRRGGFS